MNYTESDKKMMWKYTQFAGKDGITIEDFAKRDEYDK